MSYTLGKFNKDGSFYAESTAKLGKKEILISPIQQDSGKLTVSESLSVIFDLTQEKDVVNFEWIYIKSNANGKAKRKHASNGDSDKSKNESHYLAVSLKGGKILIFSPFQKNSIIEINTGFEITSLTSASKSFWVSGYREAKEYTINDINPKNTIIFPKHLKQVSSIHALHYNSADYIVVGGRGKLVVINVSNNEVYGELSDSNDDSTNPVTYITSKNGTIAAAKSESSVISLYSLDAKSNLLTLTTTENISSLFIAGNIVGSVTTSGDVELFKDALSGKSNKLTSKVSPNTTQVKFLDAVSHNSKILLSWNDITPKFIEINSKKLQAQLEIDVQYTSKQKATKPPVKTLEPIIAEIEPSSELNVSESELLVLIEANAQNPYKLLKILISNTDQEKIKDVAAQLQNHVAVKIYKAVAPRVEANPTESAALNTWLKWVIIRNSKGITDTQDVKPLRIALKKELKQLPNLLSLQGRLELLQSQLQLRSELATAEAQETQVPSDLVEKAEQTIVYLNGENDDGYDVVEEAGNSESEGEEEEDEDEELVEADEDEDLEGEANTTVTNGEK